MLDIFKAQATPQSYWYTYWTLLGADGSPDKLIKKRFETAQSHQGFLWKKAKRNTLDMLHLIKHNLDPSISLHSRFRVFKSKIVTWLSETKQEDAPTQFSLMGQCFQDIGLTKWTNIAGQAMPQWYTPDKGTLQLVHLGLPWGSCQILKHWQPTVIFASCCQEACIHVDAWVHAALSVALQLPQQRTPLLDDGIAHGARESGTNLSHAAKDASV